MYTSKYLIRISVRGQKLPLETLKFKGNWVLNAQSNPMSVKTYEDKNDVSKWVILKKDFQVILKNWLHEKIFYY